MCRFQPTAALSAGEVMGRIPSLSTIIDNIIPPRSKMSRGDFQHRPLPKKIGENAVKVRRQIGGFANGFVGGGLCIMKLEVSHCIVLL